VTAYLRDPQVENIDVNTAPLVNVALTGSARPTATMSVTPRPCVSLRRHGQIDATIRRLVQLGTIDATLEAFLAAAVKSRCNIIVTGGVDAGNTTLSPGVDSHSASIYTRRSGPNVRT
jgi:pilus assembly protein CpaF